MTLVPTDESNVTLKKYEELWKKIRDLIRSMTYNSGNYDEKYVQVKFNSNSDLELELHNKLELRSVIIVVRSVFHEDNENYPQVFL